MHVLPNRAMAPIGAVELAQRWALSSQTTGSYPRQWRPCLFTFARGTTATMNPDSEEPFLKERKLAAAAVSFGFSPRPARLPPSPSRYG
jgi:hypothetical protein